MGPWLGSCTRALGEGPAHGPLAKVLHKGSWPGSSSRAFREGLGPCLMALTLSGPGIGLAYLIAFDLIFAAWLEIEFQDEAIGKRSKPLDMLRLVSHIPRQRLPKMILPPAA